MGGEIHALLLRGSVMDVQSTPSPGRLERAQPDSRQPRRGTMPPQNLNFLHPLSAKMREYMPCFFAAGGSRGRKPDSRPHGSGTMPPQARQPTTWQRHHAAVSPTADNPAAARCRLQDCGCYPPENSCASLTHGAKRGRNTGKSKVSPRAPSAVRSPENKAHFHWLAVCIAQSRYCEQCRYGWVRKSTDKYGLGHRGQ